MKIWTTVIVASVMAVAAGSAQAATTLVNLNASSTNPNAGNSSPGYAYNPVNLSLAAGTYTVTLAGLAGGGTYDAYTVYAPTASNAAFTDSNWSVSFNNGTSAAYTQASLGRYNTAGDAFTAYKGLSYTFTLSSAQAVSFYVDDTAYPYFGDDSGGVSLAVSAVPEPASLVLLGIGALGLLAAGRWRSAARAA